MHFVFIDTECSEDNNYRTRIVSISWMITSTDKVIEKLQDYLVKPDWKALYPRRNIAHGISMSYALKNGLHIVHVLNALMEDLKESEYIIVGHKVEFDLDAIQDELDRCRLVFNINSLPSICTMTSSTAVCKLEKARNGEYKWPTLMELHQYLFGKGFFHAHTSKADVEATARCFFELRNRGVFQGLKTQDSYPNINEEKLLAKQQKEIVIDVTEHKIEQQIPYNNTPLSQIPAQESSNTFGWAIAIVLVLFILFRSCNDDTSNSTQTNSISPTVQVVQSTTPNVTIPQENASVVNQVKTNTGKPITKIIHQHERISSKNDKVEHGKKVQKYNKGNNRKYPQSDIRFCLQLQDNRAITSCVEKYH